MLDNIIWNFFNNSILKKRYLLFFLLLFSTHVYSQNVYSIINHRIFKLSPKVKKNDYLPNVIIVKYKSSTHPASKQAINSISGYVENRLKSANIISIKNKFPSQLSAADQLSSKRMDSLQLTPKEKTEVDLTNIYEIKYSGSSSIEDVINELLLDKNIEYAEPSYIYHTSYVSNDSLFLSGGQPYLNQVNTPQAWDIIKNSTNIIIAIVDNGSDLTHEDLAGNIYLNKGDPINGIDDDKDGYIDNYYGWDLGGVSASNQQGDNDPNVKSMGASHGVHVSGLASAVSNNKIGISSIAFNAKLLIIKAAADDDPNTIYMGYEGIKYAADHGAQIINCSWGSSVGGAYGQDIINYALSKNCLVIAAAGNSNSSDLEYPAAYTGVFAVANVQSSDIKNPTSNFGSYVSISAPGTNILSTIYHNQYGVLSGTSTSAPIVSSAAALVKSYFPGFTMQQVGEQLRVTADYIDNINPGLEGQLGKGRLNVFKALTQSSPSIRNQNLTIIGNSPISQGDTVNLYFDLKNFLNPIVGLNIILTSSSPFVKILTSQIAAGDLMTLQTKTLVGPFKVLILPSAPDNTLAFFRLNYRSNNNTYNDSEGFSIPIGLDYLNVQVNNINTTMASNGRVGYSLTNATNGLGFIYKNTNLLFEASLMIGNSPSQISNNASNDNGSDEDYVKKVRVNRINSTTSDFEGKSEFDDSGSINPLNIYIKHRQIAYSKVPDDKYSIAEYEVFNKGSSNLKGIYIGLFTDWDVTTTGDITKYDSFHRLAYVCGKSENTLFAGVKLLSTSAPPLYYPLTNNVQGNPLSDGFTKEGKYQTLSQGIHALSLGDKSANGYDISFVSGYGPYNIPANSSIKVSFAFLAGDNLTDLENSAVAAQEKYQTQTTDNTFSSSVFLEQNFPNPVSDNTLIRFSIPSQGIATLDVYNMMGYKISTLLSSNLNAGSYAVNMSVMNIPPGMYICRLHFNGVEKSLKILVIK